MQGETNEVWNQSKVLSFVYMRQYSLQGRTRMPSAIETQRRSPCCPMHCRAPTPATKSRTDPSQPDPRPSPSAHAISSTVSPVSLSPSLSPIPRDCREIKCREGLQCILQDDRVMCGRPPRPESCDDLECEPGYECQESEAEVLCVELTEEPSMSNHSTLLAIAT